MNILFLSGLYPPMTRGGAEVSSHLLAQGLLQRGHEVHVIAQGEQESIETVDGVTVHRVPLPLTAKPLFEQRHTRRLARSLTPTIKQLIDEGEWIIHAHDFRMVQVVSELQVLGVVDPARVVTTVRDYAQICGSPNNLLASGEPCPGCDSLAAIWQNRAIVEAPWWRKPFRAWQYRYNIGYRKSSFRSIGHHVYISDVQRMAIASQQDLSSVATTVIYNPVASEYLTEPVVQSKEKTLVFVGTVESYKGIGVLLEAFKELAEHDDSVHLKIVGDGNQRSSYETWVARESLQYRVTFAGRVPWDRMRTVYDDAWIVIAPHIWTEPFGRTVVEAMARGKIVVASNVGGPAEVLIDGKTGFLFEKGDSKALISAIQGVDAMGHFAVREMSDAARAWVRENLSVDTIAGRYEEFYSEMLED